jgi:molecular chaperone GrpE
MTTNNDAPTSANEFNTEQSTINNDDRIKELEEAIAKLEKERDDFKDKELRYQAEIQNTIKRAKIDENKARTFGSQKLLEDLIPVIDSLELGIANTQDDESDKSHTDGMSMTLDILIKTIEKHGIEQINPAGEEFNPEYHEAMTLQPTKDAKPNTIIQVLQKGYLLKERLIRPARVIVAKELT